MRQLRQVNYSKIIEWISFFGLCSISILFMKEALIKYDNKDTSIRKYELAIDVWPTITICYSEFKIEYGKDLNISLSNYILKLGDINDDFHIYIQGST